jgi:hypothetical protein
VTARSFVWTVITGTSLLLGATVCANIVTDPQGVFGTDVLAHSADPNWRYLQLKQYRRDASNIDGLIFGSSRGTYIDDGLLGRQTGSRQVLNFSVPYGLMTDHLPTLQYILDDKRARGERLRSVLLLLDLDFFGKAPWTNTNINAFLPPDVSGESLARFWWRYLTAFQYRKWRDSLRRRNRDAATELSGSIGKDDRSAHSATANFPTNTVAGASTASPSNPIAEAGQLADDAVALSHRSRNSWNATRPDLVRQISYLAQFVELCRSNNIALTVATSPMSGENLKGYSPSELEALMEKLNHLTPIWDFSSPPWLVDERHYWMDFSHFSNAIGSMMVNRMFSDDAYVRRDFGRLRAQIVQ